MADFNLSVVHMLIVILLENLDYGFHASIQIQNYQHGHLNLPLMRDLQPGFIRMGHFRIPTVKLEIPGKAFLKSESRTSVTFKL